MRFGKNGKLSPRFIGSYEVIEKVGPVAFRSSLPLELEKIHNVFYISMLRRYKSNPSHVVSSEVIELRPDLTYEEVPVELRNWFEKSKNCGTSESHWSKYSGETTRQRKSRGKVKKPCVSNIHKSSMKVISRTKFF